MTEYKITKFSFADFRRKTLRELTPHKMENLDNRTFINKVIVLATCDLDSIFKENSPYQILKARTEIDCEDMPDLTELNVKEYTNIVQVVSEEENELGATNLIFRGIASMKRLETFVKRINWRNDMEQVGHEDGTSSLEKVGKTVKNFCYEGVEGLFNEWIEPLEIEVLSRDKQFSK